MEIILQSTITCPNCGHKKEETMPTDACQYFYECENCKTVLKTTARRLLCLLQLWKCKMSANSTRQEMLLTKDKEAQPLTARFSNIFLPQAQHRKTSPSRGSLGVILGRPCRQ
jgi:transcription elongation factor Elf1